MTLATALIVVIAGPSRGQTASLDTQVSIGRDQQNSLAITDPGLSRHHCTIEPSAAGFVLRDLGSRNGVFVNNCPVTERVVKDGDQIRIGDSALLVTIPDQQGVPAQVLRSVTLDDKPVSGLSTMAIDAASSCYLTPARPSEHVANRSAHDLAVLFGLSEALQRVHTLDELSAVLLTSALEAAQVAGAAILTTATGDDAFSVVAARPAGEGGITVCRAVAARAINERAAVFANDDVPTLCVPLLESAGGSSVLCLTGIAGTTRFSANDLQLLAAIGSIGGLASERIRHLEWLQGENARLRKDSSIAHNLVGDGPAMQRVYQFISRVAATDATVLLRGESGTGKELIASAIHTNGPRGRGPFVPINCAAIPDALLESELFGHERGAFTGAVDQQRGRLELADRGTVFLDEVGELAPGLQAKLLRVLQDQVVERLGGRRGIKIDVRVIAATNRDLEAAIASGGFRKDLYYRLNVVSLAVPPLKDRREDLPLLAAYFVRQHAVRCKRVVKGISPAAKALLLNYDWPGNVRELSNAIERAVVLGSTEVILPEDLPETLLESSGEHCAPEAFHARVVASKREVIREALERSGGNVAQAARLLSLQPTYLHRLIRTLGLSSSTNTGAVPK